MDTKLLNILNEQFNAEIFSSYLYLAMSSNIANKGYAGFAHWFQVQAQEEMIHAMKIYNFIIERGETVVFSTIEKPQNSWDSILEIFEAAHGHEKKISSMIREIYRVAREVFDPETEIFLNWFITEQIEEEADSLNIVQQIKLTQNVPAALFAMDRELGSRPSLITLPTEKG